MEIEYEGYDSPEDIQRCLHCTRPKCVNCLDSAAAKAQRVGTVRKHPQEKIDRVAELRREGLTVKAIGERLGIPASTVYHYVCRMRVEGYEGV